MNRREFSAATLASALTVAGAAQANTDEIRPRLSPFSHVFLQAPGQLVVHIRFFAVALAVARDRTLALDLRQEQPQIDEQRADLGDLLGDLTVPTVSRALRGASEIGTVHLAGQSLILAPTVGQTVPAEKVRLVHQDRSWLPGQRLRPLRLSGIPLLGDVLRLPRVGRAWRSDRTLLVMLRPSLVKGYD